MKQFFRKILELILYPIPVTWIGSAALWLVAAGIKGAPPKNVLKTLLVMDNYLYGLTGRVAIRYGSGNHVKHRLTGYVEHFVGRALKLGGPYLDIGCAQGTISGELVRVTSSRIVGVDKDKEAIVEAKKRFTQENLEFIEGDARTLDLKESFNTIILSNVLEHIDNRVDFLIKIQQLYGAKYWLIRVPNFERDWRVPLKKELEIAYMADATHFIEHTPRQFQEEVEHAGLKIIEIDFRWGEIWAVLSS